MQTIQQHTRRLTLNHLTASPPGRVLTLAGIGGAGLGRGVVRTQNATPEPFADPADVINYALTLEHMENVFYRVGLKKFETADFEALGYQGGVRDNIAAISAHEKAHVDALTMVVEQLGGEPVEEGKYAFGYRTLAEFLQVAATLEAVGVAAYGGAAQYLQGENDLLTMALTIHSVEARHAAYLNLVTGGVPFPAAFEEPMTREQVLEAAGPFITST